MAADVNLSSLDALISKLRRSRDFIVRAAPEAAAAMQDALRETAEAGTAPDGTPWAPRKKDGRPALPDAADAINVSAIGTVLLARIGFPYSLHNAGRGHAPGRKILPSGGVPDRVMQAVKRSLIESWEASK